MKAKSKYSIRSLVKEFPIDRSTATKLLAGITSECEAREALTAWCEQHPNETDDLDPESGLTWWKAKLREDVLKSRTMRERERQLAGGELVPVNVIEQAAREFGHQFDRLVSDAYLAGLVTTQEQRETLGRMAARTKQDFQNYIHQWLARQAEIQKEAHD
jgi:hypothetical protein